MSLFTKFLVMLFIIKIVSTPVDCKTNVQTVLEIPQKVDCQDRPVCLTQCTDFIKGCPSTYLQQYGTHVTNHAFEPLYFELLSKTNPTVFSTEAFQRTCVDFEFNSVTNNDAVSMFEISKNYLSILGFSSKKLLDAFLMTTWMWKSLTFPQIAFEPKNRTHFLEDGYKSYLDRTENQLVSLKMLKQTFTKEEKEVFSLIYELVRERVHEKLEVLTLNKYFSNNVMLSWKRFLYRIGKDIKTEYYGVSTLKIIDKWMEFLLKFGKQCEGKSSAKKMEELLNFEKEYTMKNEYYPFEKGTTFIRGKDESNPEYQALMEFKKVWYLMMLKYERIGKIKICNCFSMQSFYNIKAKEMTKNGQSPKELLREQELKTEIIKKSCTVECARRKEFIKKMDIQNKKVYDDYIKKLNP